MKNILIILAFAGLILMSFDEPTVKPKTVFIPRVTEWNAFAQKIIRLHRINRVTGTTYYVDATGGSDTDDGTTTGKAWRTIAKVNAFNFTAGDQVLFKRGETFFGAINVHDDNMTFDAYGTGADPVITGFQTISSFTPSINNRYRANISADTTLNMVTINGVPQQVATGANPDSLNGGWKTFRSVASYNGSPTTRDTICGMPAGMVGRHILIKQNDWTIMEVVVVQQWGDTCKIQLWRTLNIGGNSGLDQSKDKYGWKPYRDSTYADRQGEYVYAAGQLNINLGSGPAGKLVQYSAVDTLFDNGSFDGTTINNLKFTGGNKFAIWATTADGITVDNCTIDLMGSQGFAGYRLSNLLIQNCMISNCMATGIYVQSTTSPYSNVDILNNILTKIGKLEGMGSWGMFGDYSAMNVNAYQYLNVKYNIIFDVGDCGIKWNGSFVELAYNSVMLFCQILQDHGAYYCYWSFDVNQTDHIAGNTVYFRARWVHHNIGAYGIGCINGTAPLSNGNPPPLRASIFYSDGINGYTLYEFNVGYNYSRSFLNLNIDSNITARNNLALPGDSLPFLSARCVGIQQQAIPIRNLHIANNVFILSNPTQTTIAYYAPVAQSALAANISAIGLIDSNYVNFFPYATWYTLAGNTASKLTQTGFRTFSGYGANDILIPNYPASQVRFIFNWTPGAVGYSLAGTYKDVYGTTFTNTITLQPYTAAYLIFEAAPVDQPGYKLPLYFMNN